LDNEQEGGTTLDPPVLQFVVVPRLETQKKIKWVNDINLSVTHFRFGGTHLLSVFKKKCCVLLFYTLYSTKKLRTLQLFLFPQNEDASFIGLED
jgi:hypothetical protein